MGNYKNRRPQTSKRERDADVRYMEGMQELRKGSRTSPHKSAKDYQRKPKHGNFNESE